eukprot:16367-Heterococcus_DN1.PRE.3
MVLQYFTDSTQYTSAVQCKHRSAAYEVLPTKCISSTVAAWSRRAFYAAVHSACYCSLMGSCVLAARQCIELLAPRAFARPLAQRRASCSL